MIVIVWLFVYVSLYVCLFFLCFVFLSSEQILFFFNVWWFLNFCFLTCSLLLFLLFWRFSPNINFFFFLCQIFDFVFRYFLYFIFSTVTQTIKLVWMFKVRLGQCESIEGRRAHNNFLSVLLFCTLRVHLNLKSQTLNDDDKVRDVFVRFLSSFSSSLFISFSLFFVLSLSDSLTRVLVKSCLLVDRSRRERKREEARNCKAYARANSDPRVWLATWWIVHLKILVDWIFALFLFFFFIPL